MYYLYFCYYDVHSAWNFYFCIIFGISFCHEHIFKSIRFRKKVMGVHRIRICQSRYTRVMCIDCSDIDVANTLVQLKRSAESRRRPLGCRNGSADRSSRSPSPPEFGTDYDRSFLRLKLRSSIHLLALSTCVVWLGGIMLKLMMETWWLLTQSCHTCIQ